MQRRALSKARDCLGNLEKQHSRLSRDFAPVLSTPLLEGLRPELPASHQGNAAKQLAWRQSGHQHLFPARDDRPRRDLGSFLNRKGTCRRPPSVSLFLYRQGYKFEGVFGAELRSFPPDLSPWRPRNRLLCRHACTNSGTSIPKTSYFFYHLKVR